MSYTPWHRSTSSLELLLLRLRLGKEWSWTSCLSYCYRGILQSNCSWYWMIKRKPSLPSILSWWSRSSIQLNCYHSWLGSPCCCQLHIKLNIFLWKHIFVSIYRTLRPMDQQFTGSGRHICTYAQEGKCSYWTHPNHSTQIINKCTILNYIFNFQLESYR